MLSAIFNSIKSSLQHTAVINVPEKTCFLGSRFPVVNSTQIREIGRTTVKRRRTRPPGRWARKNSNILNDYITPENKELLNKLKAGMLFKEQASILKEGTIEKSTWTPGSKRTGVICRKIGIYPMWTKSGKRLLTTLLQVVDNHVVKYHPPEVVQKNNPKQARKRPGMGIVVVGAEASDPELYTNQYLGLFKEAGILPKKKLSRFFVTPDAALTPGTPLYASHFKPGEYVNVVGKTVDHGFQGVVKRWGFKGGPQANGCTKSHRRPGFIGAGAGYRDHVWKGTKMPGHMGCEHRMLHGLKIWRVNTKHNVIWVHGPAVPGPVNAWVLVLDTMIAKKSHTADNPPHFPTAYQDEWKDFPEELYDEQLHTFSESSITFEDNVK